MGQESDKLTGARPESDTYADEAYTEGKHYETTSGLVAPGVTGSGIAGGSAFTGSVGDPYTDEAQNVAFDAQDTGGDVDDDLEEKSAQIEQTRSQLSSTIDAIQEKLSPANIAQQAKDTVKEATVGKAQEMVSNAGNAATDMVSTAGNSAKGFGSNFVETVKANPVPAAIAGLGLGWLFVSGRKQSSGSDAYRGGYASGYTPRGSDQYPRYGSSDYGSSNSPLSDRLSATQSKVGDMADQAQGKVSDMASGVQDTASQAAGAVQDTASQLAGNAQYGAQRAQSAFQQSLSSNPLAIGVVALAVGAAVGLSIPETDKENEMLGETRDTVVQQAQQTVQEKAQQVQSVAQQAVGAAKDAAGDAAQDQGLTSK